MAVIGNIAPERAPGAKLAKVQLEDDTYNATIAKISFFHEDANGQLVANEKPNTVRVNVTLDDEQDGEGNAVTLSRKMTLSTFKNAHFAKFLSAATGAPVEDEPALRAIDTDDLIGKPIRVLTAFNCEKGWTNIQQFLAPKKRAERAAA
jgi:hypothetical protein